jgi:3-oxoacyl-[acyl-carrier-protein] synthase-3
MKEIGFEIPYEKWFTNLYTKGNTGSAAIYIIIEDIFKSGRLKKGQQLLCFIPESGRFSHCFMMLSVI